MICSISYTHRRGVVLQTLTDSKKMSSQCDRYDDMSSDMKCDVSKEWNLIASDIAQGVVNPIRQIVDGMTISPNPNKELIKLTIGMYLPSTFTVSSVNSTYMSYICLLNSVHCILASRVFIFVLFISYTCNNPLLSTVYATSLEVQYSTYSAIRYCFLLYISLCEIPTVLFISILVLESFATLLGNQYIMSITSA